MEEAKEIFERFGFEVGTFKSFNGWLKWWKKWQSIKKLVMCGGSGDVRGETVVLWKERLPEIVSSYASQDVWNLVDLGLFWHALPEKGWDCYHIPCILFNTFFLHAGLAQEVKNCAGGKKSKHRNTIVFMVNAAGGNESSHLLLWNFRILDWILGKLKSGLKSESGRNPKDLQFSNTTVSRFFFLSTNTTSKLQPL